MRKMWIEKKVQKLRSKKDPDAAEDDVVIAVTTSKPVLAHLFALTKNNNAGTRAQNVNTTELGVRNTSRLTTNCNGYNTAASAQKIIAMNGQNEMCWSTAEWALPLIFIKKKLTDKKCGKIQKKDRVATGTQNSADDLANNS